MSQLRAKRPSPALVISILALFVALGGSAYAAKKIGSKEIKNNAITAAKIKKNAITTPKLQNNAVTGAKINEGSLGAVPNATNAAHATTADTASSFTKYVSSGLKKASIGQTITLLTVGPFTFTGKCTNNGSDPEARTYLTTSQVGSSMYSYEDSYDEADFNPNVEVEVGYYASDNGPYIRWYDQYPYYTGFWTASADGATLLHGDAVNAVNVFGAQCAFWVEATNPA